jgi:hypothetical protein
MRPAALTSLTREFEWGLSCGLVFSHSLLILSPKSVSLPRRMADAPRSNAPLSIAQRLYTDVLLCLFAFFDLEFYGDAVAPLLPAIRTCKAWYRAALQERSRACMFEARSSKKLHSVCHSALRFHVTKLELQFQFLWNDLSLVCSRLPHLKSV